MPRLRMANPPKILMGLADSESGLSLFQPWTKKCANDFFLPGNSRGLNRG